MDVFAPNSKFWEEYEELRAEDKLSDARFNDPEEDAREIGIYSY